jgi:prepilin-type N-terminal cleavage/methylation domain-containing protein
MGMKAYSRQRKGFTLTELIIVISILLVLSTVAIVAYGNFMENARASADRSDASNIVRVANTRNSLARLSARNALQDEEDLENFIVVFGLIDLSLYADRPTTDTSAGITDFEGRVSYNGERHTQVFGLIQANGGYFSLIDGSGSSPDPDDPED